MSEIPAVLPDSSIEIAAQAQDGHRLAAELEAAGYPRAAQYLRVLEARIDELEAEVAVLLNEATE